MKKTIIVIFLFLISSTVFSQARIGFTKDEIEKEFKNYSPFFDDVSKNHSLVVSFEFGPFGYLLDSSNVCYQCVFKPDSEETLFEFIRKYNKDYVILNEREWKTHDNPPIYIILESYPEFNFNYFRFSLNNSNSSNK